MASSLRKEFNCLPSIVVPELDLEASRHSVTISLPSMKAREEADERSISIPGLIPQSASEITDAVSLSTQSGMNSTSVDSKELEGWEDSDSVRSQQAPATHEEGYRPNPGIAEWVLLSD